jgi:hypothetical protein
MSVTWIDLDEMPQKARIGMTFEEGQANRKTTEAEMGEQ